MTQTVTVTATNVRSAGPTTIVNVEVDLGPEETMQVGPSWPASIPSPLVRGEVTIVGDADTRGVDPYDWCSTRLVDRLPIAGPNRIAALAEIWRVAFAAAEKWRLC